MIRKGLSGILSALVFVGALVFLAYATTFMGTAGNDLFEGTSAVDRMFGRGGNDTLYGKGHSDFLWGDCANEIVRALPGDSQDSCTGFAGHTFGDDTLFGGPGHDRIFGETGDDAIYGGPGNDYIEGGRDSDTIGDDNGNRRCDPGEEPGNDTIWGDAPTPNPMTDDIDGGGVEDDFICGGDGNDIIYGSDDDDEIWGGRGLNRISAGANDDTIYVDPWSQKDIINCGEGDDTVYLNGNNRALWTDDGANFGPGTFGYVNLMQVATAPATLPAATVAAVLADCETIIP